MKTTGHLTENGGLRGHSIGKYFPWIVFAKGTFINLKWYVQAPNGDISHGYDTASEAGERAQHEFDKGVKL